MSNKHMVKLFSSVGIGFLVGFVTMKTLQKSNSSSASLASNKKAILELGKLHMLTSVRIVTPERGPASDDDNVELKGFVTLHEETDRPLFWEWVLPEGVTIVEGKLKDFEAQPQSGHTYGSAITVKGFGKSSRKIIALTGYVDYEDSRKGNSTTASSNPESSFEYIAPALKAEVDYDKSVSPGRR